MNVTEIAPDIYRISVYVPDLNMQFNHFLIKDDEPLLFHTGANAIFEEVYRGVARIIDPATLRWISFSHFEADECGSLNRWLAAAPQAEAACSQIGALVNVNDYALRPARPLSDGESFVTGRHSFRFVQTPHLPHCWEAGLLFEETGRTLFCSDLFFQPGDAAPLAEADVLEKVRSTIIEEEAGPFANSLPYTHLTEANLQKLTALRPRTFATMHGSSFSGRGEELLREFGSIMREVLLQPAASILA